MLQQCLCVDAVWGVEPAAQAARAKELLSGDSAHVGLFPVPDCTIAVACPPQRSAVQDMTAGPLRAALC